MKEEILFTIDAPYRPALPVRGWRFGNPEGRDLAVMGALRGNEIQQMYVCGRLISALQTAAPWNSSGPTAGAGCSSATGPSSSTATRWPSACCPNKITA